MLCILTTSVTFGGSPASTLADLSFVASMCARVHKNGVIVIVIVQFIIAYNLARISCPTVSYAAESYNCWEVGLLEDLCFEFLGQVLVP